jgi:hypothetical protein
MRASSRVGVQYEEKNVNDIITSQAKINFHVTKQSTLYSLIRRKVVVTYI